MDWHSIWVLHIQHLFLHLCDLTNIHTPVRASKQTWGSLPYLRMEKPGIEPLTLSAHQITYCRLFKKPKVWDTELTGLLEKDSFVVRAGDCCILSSKKKSSGCFWNSVTITAHSMQIDIDCGAGPNVFCSLASTTRSLKETEMTIQFSTSHCKRNPAAGDLQQWHYVCDKLQYNFHFV